MAREFDPEEAELVSRITASDSRRKVVETTLATDERVIARVTDGIYRQPASSLRELISNAYDADASRVVIKTDPPRFLRITVEDNGHGMTPSALAHLLRHIGGSAKRSDTGQSLGITAASDPTKSPNGRELIGKIGIGLFSVAQLTHSFQIITKVKDDKFRTIATIALRQYSDEPNAVEPREDGKFESGKVAIWREPAADVDSHGTTIVLTNVRPQARDTLRSREIWAAIEQSETSAPDGEDRLDPPTFPIGRVDADEQSIKPIDGKEWSLPWKKSDSPDDAFRKFVDCVWSEAEHSTPNPRLDRIFDYYLRMVWHLSLAAPLPYVDGHPFDLGLKGWASGFLLSNSPKGAPTSLKESSKPLRAELNLQDPVERIGTFDIFFDDLKLSRPLRFKGLPSTENALKQPIIFVGKCLEEFSKIPPELSGGTLRFEAYLFWTPKIAPTEHQGSLIRIHGASGTLFDPTFMRYQVQEIQRLKQITCEIFVSRGLDSALNIDRESFNNAHPHAVYITKWLHSALRQVASAQKRLSGEIRELDREERESASVSRIKRLAREVWKEESDDPGGRPPAVVLAGANRAPKAKGEAYIYSRSAIVPESARRKSGKAQSQAAIIEEKVKAIAQVLASFGLLDAIPKRKQERLLRTIYKILESQ